LAAVYQEGLCFSREKCQLCKCSMAKILPLYYSGRSSQKSYPDWHAVFNHVSFSD